MTRPGRNLSHALFWLSLVVKIYLFLSSPKFPWFSSLWTMITFITSAYKDWRCLLVLMPCNPPLRSLCSQTNQSKQMPVNTLPFIGMRVFDLRWRPPLLRPTTFYPSPHHLQPLPGVLITHRGLKSHSGIPGLQRHIGRRKTGFMAHWWTMGEVRVGFKEEDELVVLSYSRRLIMMWLFVVLPPSPPTAGEPTHGFKLSQVQSPGKFSLDKISVVVGFFFFNLNGGVLAYSDVATHTMRWHLHFHFSSRGDLGKRSVFLTQFISVVPQQPLRLDFLWIIGNCESLHLFTNGCAARLGFFFVVVVRAIIPQDPHVKLIGVCSDVSHRQMCNEPCFVSVTFGMMDGNGRPFNRQQRIPFNNMQLSGCRTLK